MTEVINVKFRSKGKVYYFDPAGLTVECGQPVIVETAKGLEFGDCTKGNHLVEDSLVVQPLRPVIRIATDEDCAMMEKNRAREKEAFAVCQEKIAAHGLDMKLVDVEYNFEGSKIIFFFTSDGRVDFRDLVKDLASVFRTRIELRQIGVRDEAKMLGGLGICGKPFCCATFLDDFQPVSIKMAKTQSLSLNPAKISGTCGRLMCCLKYEQDAYESLLKSTPKVGAEVEAPSGKGVVTAVNLLKQKVKVKVSEAAGEETYEVSELGEGAAERYAEKLRLKREAELRSERIEPIFKSIGAKAPENSAAEEPAEQKPEEPKKPEGQQSQNRKRRRRPGRQGKPKAAVQPEQAPKPVEVKPEPQHKKEGGRRRPRRGRGKPKPNAEK